MPDVSDADRKNEGEENVTASTRKAVTPLFLHIYGKGRAQPELDHLVEEINDGQFDYHYLFQAFARHAAEAKAERTAEIVAMAREKATRFPGAGLAESAAYRAWRDIAEQIEEKYRAD